MIPYGCLSTGSSIGMIEVVQPAETLATLQKKKGGVTAAFSKDSIWDWLREYHADEERCVSIKFLEAVLKKIPNSHYQDNAWWK